MESLLNVLLEPGLDQTQDVDEEEPFAEAERGSPFQSMGGEGSLIESSLLMRLEHRTYELNLKLAEKAPGLVLKQTT